MHPRKAATVAALFALFATLAAALVGYGATQRSLVLEGHRLYSAEAVRVIAAPDELVAAVTATGLDARVFRTLTDDGTVRAMREFGTAPDRLPRHTGRDFHPDERAGLTRAAMVGPDADVPRGENLDLLGHRYPVVAALGLTATGLVENDVVLTGPGLITGATIESLVADGPGIGDALRLVFDPAAVAPVGGNSSGRTNVDHVSAIMLGFGWTLCALGGILTGVLAASFAAGQIRVRFRVGRTRGRLLLGATLARVPGPLLIAAAVLAVTAMVAGPMVSVAEAGRAVAVLLALMIAGFAATTAVLLGGRRAWT